MCPVDFFLDSPSSALEKVTSSSKIFAIGSINIDHIYECPKMPSVGFCTVCPNYRREIGGKGLNQAFALFNVFTWNYVGCA